MPYAVIEQGGKQYRVQEGDIIKVDLVDAEPGTELQFERVLAYHDGSTLKIGTPVLDDVGVAGTITAETKGPKVVAYKFKRRKTYRRTVGHRQKLLNVKITKLG